MLNSFASFTQYKNVKPDVSSRINPLHYASDGVHTQYLNAIWNVINFKEAEKRFVAAAK